MTVRWSWLDRAPDGLASRTSGCARVRVSRSGCGVRRHTRHQLDVDDPPKPAARGSPDRQRAAFSSCRDRACGGGVHAKTRGALRRARRSIRGEPRGAPARGNWDSTAPRVVSRTRIVRALLRGPGDARPYRACVRASGTPALAIGAFPRLGPIALTYAHCLVQRDRRRSGRSLRRRATLARAPRVSPALEARRDRGRGGAARTAAHLVFVPARHLSAQVLRAAYWGGAQCCPWQSELVSF